MRIGILTVPFNNNYGGLLQAFALKSVLIEMGHEVMFVNRRRPEPKILKYRIYKLLVKLHIIDDYLEKKSKEISRYTDVFKTQHLDPITEPYYTEKDLKKCLDQGIAFFIVGSDQVWRYSYAESTITDFFFGFLKNVSTPRMSYAASFGIDIMDYPEETKEVVAELLKVFKGISVREESGKNLLTECFGVPENKAKVVLDPTLLLSAEKYKTIFREKMRMPEHYIFSYILDSSVVDNNKADMFCGQLQKERLDMRAQTGITAEQGVIAPVEDWLKGICCSDGVITDSFHGTVFSIIFNRPFLVVANPNRGISRLQSLLAMFGLEDRLVVDSAGLTADKMKVPIDWAKINSRIAERQKDSMAFLNSALDLNRE